MKKENEEPTEKKIERSLFSMKCSNCGKEIKGTSLKQLKHTYGMHLLYCSKLKEMEKNESNNKE